MKERHPMMRFPFPWIRGSFVAVSRLASADVHGCSCSCTFTLEPRVSHPGIIIVITTSLLSRHSLALCSSA